MQHNNHCGESWDDLCLNDMICAQTQARANKQELMDLPEWMREMCHWGTDPKVKMVTKEQAFQFGRLVALEMWREVTKERRRLDQLMDKLVKFEELKAEMWELMEMNLNLVHHVSMSSCYIFHPFFIIFDSFSSLFLCLFHSILRISIPQHHTRSLSFLLPFFKIYKWTARQRRRYSIEGC